MVMRKVANRVVMRVSQTVALWVASMDVMRVVWKEERRVERTVAMKDMLRVV